MHHFCRQMFLCVVSMVTNIFAHRLISSLVCNSTYYFYLYRLVCSVPASSLRELDVTGLAASSDIFTSFSPSPEIRVSSSFSLEQKHISYPKKTLSLAPGRTDLFSPDYTRLFSVAPGQACLVVRLQNLSAQPAVSVFIQQSKEVGAFVFQVLS